MLKEDSLEATTTNQERTVSPATSDTPFHTELEANDSDGSFESMSSSIESAIDDIEVANESQLLTFISTLQDGISNLLKATKAKVQPAWYNKLGNPAPRTKCQHKHDAKNNQKAYRAQGYPDIRSFFQRLVKVW